MLHLGGSGSLRGVLSQEVANQIIGRVLQHLFRRGHLDHLSAFHEDDDVRQFQCLAHVVADKDNGLAQLLLDVLHLVLKRLPGHGVQGGEGLIHQHDGGRGCQSPQHADALLLAAGELGRVFIGLGLHAHHFQKILDDVRLLLLIVLQKPGHHADVLGHGHVGEQTDLLDDVADVAAQFYLVLGVNILAVDGDGAGINVNEPVDGLEGGGFAAAGGADEDHKLPVGNGEVQVLQNGGLAVTFADMFKLNHWYFTPLL